MSDATSVEDLLSAHLDGELAPDEEAAVRTALAADPALRRSLDELAAVRGALRALPPVEPPSPLVAAPLAPVRPLRRRLVVAGAGLAAAATIVLVALVVGAGDPAPMVPPVSDFAARHGAMAGDAPMPADGFEPVAEPELAAMEDAPPGALAGGFVRMAGYHDSSGTMHVVYGRDDGMVSVYRQEGTVDWAALPAGGEQMEMDGSPAWLVVSETPSGPEEIMVLQHGEVVYTFVASVPHDQMMQVVEGVALGA